MAARKVYLPSRIPKHRPCGSVVRRFTARLENLSGPRLISFDWSRNLAIPRLGRCIMAANAALKTGSAACFWGFGGRRHPFNLRISHILTQPHSTQKVRKKWESAVALSVGYFGGEKRTCIRKTDENV